MVKVCMNIADVVAEVECLRRLNGMRGSNVYDLSPKGSSNAFAEINFSPRLLGCPAILSLATIDAIQNMGNQCDGAGMLAWDIKQGMLADEELYTPCQEEK